MLKTKAPVTVAEYGDRYCLMGPLSYGAQIEFEPRQPSSAQMRSAIEQMGEQGVKVRTPAAGSPC